jgi:hypothetical protein
LGKTVYWTRKQWEAANSTAIAAVCANKLNMKNAIEATAAQIAIQRAYVSYQTIDVNGPYQSYFEKISKYGYHSYTDLALTFYTHMFNSGQTPANVFAQSFDSEISAHDPSETSFIGTPRRQAESFGPKINWVLAPKRYPLHIFTDLQTKYSNLDDSVAVPRFWGWIAYRDVLDRTQVHVTEFCEVMNLVEQLKPDDFRGWAFGFGGCKSHSCTDQDCPDYDRVKDAALKAK